MGFGVNQEFGGFQDVNDDPQKNRRKMFVKEDLAPKKISHIQFGMLSKNEMQRLSEFQVWSNQLYCMPARTPAVGGCLDPRLGVSDKVSTCATCKKKLTDCAGHYGYIRLCLPVFHIGFFKNTLNILQAICKKCSRVLLTDSVRQQMLRRIRNPRADVLSKEATLKKVLDLCKKAKTCPHCHSPNGGVKKVTGLPTLKIVHERFKPKQAEDAYFAFSERLESARSTNQSLPDDVRNAVEDLLPTRVLELFQRIPDEDCEVLWMDPRSGRPENLLLQYILVPPVPIRPSVSMDGGSNEDDLTVKLQEILEVNLALEIAMSKGPATRTIMENWQQLQMLVAQFINGDTPGITRPIDVKAIKGFCQRIKGKQGRFRGNLSGKRVDFSARTVISPDPNLNVDQVGIPVHVAKIMTYPECVSRYNIAKLRERVRNGPDIHPGANQIRLTNGLVMNLAYGDRDVRAKQLQYGDIVERHMEDGDVVLFNRQPSLHKMSIMSHRVKVMNWRTFRFNICVCGPYNADFDGDEMNVHLPQTEEARTEATLLMGVHNNLITTRNGEPLVAASQDFLSISYLITQRDQFFTREQFCSLVTYFSNADEHIDLPIPAVLKPIELWTGKQLFSLILRPTKDCKVLVNFETKDKNYRSDLKLKHFCPNDGWVAFRNSELISGNIAKKSIGDGSKTGLLYVLLKDFGPVEAARLLDRFSKLCSRYFGNHRGFSIGVSDVTPSEKLRAMKFDILSKGYSKAEDNIKLYDDGTLELRPGCNLQQSLEEVLNGILGKLRESAGQEAMNQLPWSNAPRIMADCGSKGSTLNISQMMACVGQQNVGGKRIQDGFVNRTLPHFEYHSLTPAAKGFVANSFYTGLAATEFFFHTMGGREGLVDTAVKTAETGYMARRLMKALEDLSLQYDSSVRNSERTVVQFIYGDDSLDPKQMENNDRPFDLDRLHLDTVQKYPCHSERAFNPDELLSFINSTLEEERFQCLLPKGVIFFKDVNDFFEDKGVMLKKLIDQIIDDGSRDDIINQRIWNRCRFTETQVNMMLEKALSKYVMSAVEPGEAIGASGAQSISEPGTQMTLKTFHFAGVSSMNVTLGVPRLKEIINASKAISTPIITAALVQNDHKVGARVVKAVIEKTTLGEIATYIKEVYSPKKCYLSVQLDMEAIDQLKLDIDAWSVRKSILNGAKGVRTKRGEALSSLTDSDIVVKKGSKSKLRIFVPETTKSGKSTSSTTYFTMQALKVTLPQVIVQGIPTVNRAVINKEDKNGKSTYHLLIEGTGLAEVMGSPGVDGKHTTTNHLIEVEATLGVEAARTSISSEISSIMDAYGIGIDHRHLLLLSDVMTFKGQVLGITRFGLSKMRNSVLSLAAFETPTIHLFEAAVHGRTDAICGVAESVIMGTPIPLGTGLFKLLKKANAPVKQKTDSNSEPLPRGLLLSAGEA